MRPLLIIGAGGFGQECAWVAEEMNGHLAPDVRDGDCDGARWEILGYADSDASRHGREIYGYRVLGAPVPAVVGDRAGPIWFSCAIGDNRARERVAGELAAFGWRAATLIHPSVIRARLVEVGEGTYVGAGSILSPNARVGRHVIINQRVAIGHDAVLGDFSQACPGAQVNGSCTIGRGAMIGSNASLHPGVGVGDFAVVGANSQVIRKVASSTSVCGVPARVLATVNAPPSGRNQPE